MNFIHDRRGFVHLPTEEDYDRPLTRASLTEANRRFRQTGVPRVVSTDREKAANIVQRVTRDRNKGKIETGSTVGEYLEFLNGIAEQEK